MAPFFFEFRRNYTVYNEKGRSSVGRAAVLRDAYGRSRVQIHATFFSKSKIFPGVIFDFNSH